MKIQEVELSLHSTTQARMLCYRGVGMDWCLDDLFAVLRRYYNLPKMPPKCLSLSLHDKLTKGRLALRVVRNWYGSLRLNIPDGCVFSNHLQVNILLPEKLVGKTVYLQVEYCE